MSANDPTEEGTSPPSEMEVFSEAGSCTKWTVAVLPLGELQSVNFRVNQTPGINLGNGIGGCLDLQESYGEISLVSIVSRLLRA